MNKPLQLAPNAKNIEETLASIDNLRAMVESGQVIAFCAVGIAPNRETLMWCGAAQPMKAIEMMGAVSALWHDVMHGDVTTE